MQRSVDRILTTHVGSLPRPQPVVDQLFAQDSGAAYVPAEFDAVMDGAVADVVRRQVEAGLDIICDGEMSKISYATYIRHRLTGFELGEMPRAVPHDLDDYPEYKDRLARLGGTPKYQRPICTGPIAVKDLSGLEADIARLKAAGAAAGAERLFMNAASPGVIAVFQPNTYYPTQEKYLDALAAAMRPEYEMIVAAGLILQIDAPDLAMGRHIRFRDADDAEFLRNANLQVEALNHALAHVPADRVRMHLCWGNYEGPHHHDVPLEKIIGIVLRANAQAYLMEASNPRHAHEWEVWAATDIPDDKVLIPGVIDSVTNFIEHPRLVGAADLEVRRCRRARTGHRRHRLRLRHLRRLRRHPSPDRLGQARSMAEGAEIASKQLWGR